MILECEKCGAPLDVLPSTIVTRCAYCGARQRVTQERTRQQQTPPGWQPPPQWTRRDHSGRQVTLNYDANKTIQKGIKYIIIWVVLMFAVPVIITFAVIIFIFLMSQRGGGWLQPEKPPERLVLADGMLPGETMARRVKPAHLHA